MLHWPNWRFNFSECLTASIKASISNPPPWGWDYFHTIFYLMLSASGALVQTEVLTNLGRLDIVVEFHDKVFVIELKCNQTSDKAIAQILKKKYYEKYMRSNRTIYLMGVDFNAEERTVDDWKCGEPDEYLTAAES